MSVIVAVNDGKTVYMGCDTLTSGGKDKITKLDELAFKIKRLDNNMLVGFCGKVSGHQLLFAHPEIFNIQGDTLTKADIVNNMIPKIIALLKDTASWRQNNNTMQNTILLAHKNKLYKIYQDFSVVNYTEYVYSGSGGDYTLSTISDTDLPIRTRILKSLQISADLCEGVKEPFVLIDTDKLQFEIVEDAHVYCH